MPVKLLNAHPDGVPMTPTPKQLMMDMIKEYRNTLHKLSTASLQQRFPDRTFPDGSPFCETNSAWVSRDELEALLDQNRGDGLRIYFGCHDKKTFDLKTGTPEYLGMHNVILVATQSGAEGKGPQSKDQLKEASTEADANSIVFTSGPYEGNSGDLIDLCPPNCPNKPPFQ
ncbi:MAG: hypothetical protein JSS98_11395 [Bacteroidetes bacterium]|nr:hypothetical protein [Bacteroidota bacterium]